MSPLLNQVLLMSTGVSCAALSALAESEGAGPGANEHLTLGPSDQSGAKGAGRDVVALGGRPGAAGCG